MTIKERINSIAELLGAKSEVKQDEVKNEDVKTELAADPAVAPAPADDLNAKYEALLARVDALTAKMDEIAKADVATAMSKQDEAMKGLLELNTSLSAEIEALKVVPQGDVPLKEKKVNNDKTIEATEKTLTKTAETLKWRIKNGYSQPSTLKGMREATAK